MAAIVQGLSAAIIIVRSVVNLNVMSVVSNVKTTCNKCRFKSRNIKSKNS